MRALSPLPPLAGLCTIFWTFADKRRDMIVAHKDTDLNASSIRIVHWDGQSLDRTCLAKWLVLLGHPVDMTTAGSDSPGAVPACGHPKSRRILKAPVSHSFGWNVGCSSVLALESNDQARQGCTESRFTGRNRVT